ncbi:MAG: D-glycero-beta-D-manno-heptose 1,7-bisphosphate 7-phosphatase [Solirubrobacterales bacterium]
MTRRYVLVDRDGTINVDKHYLSDPDGLELIPGAAEGLRLLTEKGFGIAVLTNQSGVARGYFGAEQLERIHARLKEMLAEQGVQVAGIYICPHGPDDDCTCRKPLPGMVEQAVAELGFDPREAFMIGDKQADVDLGKAVGATAILVRTGYGAETEAKGKAKAKAADYVVDDLRQAADLIVRLAG